MKHFFKSLFIILIILCLFALSACTPLAIPTSPLKAIQKNIEATEVIKLIELNEDKDALCLFRNSNGSVGVSYLNCKGRDKYIMTNCFESLGERISYNFSCADSNLKIYFELYGNHTLVSPTAFHTEEITVDGINKYFCVLNVSNEKVSFNKTHSFDRNYLHDSFDELIGSMQEELESKAYEFKNNLNNALS